MRFLARFCLILAVLSGAAQAAELCSPATGYEARGGKILRNGAPLEIRGVNWFGFETSYQGLHGLWTGRTIPSFLDQVKGLGFNALRIPVTGDTLAATSGGKDGYQTPKAQLLSLLAEAEKRNMVVLLDLHNCASGQSHADKPAPGMGSCAHYSQDEWVRDLEQLAQISLTHPAVMGIDLFNEPYGPTWQQWKVMAERAGNAVVRVNPRVLVFVEGVGGEGNTGGFGVFWGENLTDAGRDPVRLPAGRLVYSPHAYGPSVFMQGYFQGGDFPRNMPQIWETHFGHLVGKGVPVVFGEFGGRYEGLDKVWQDAFVGYMRSKGLKDYFYWSLNPNSGDTGGILNDDWTSVRTDKVTLLKSL